MANQWFRLYGEFAYDPKVQMLSEVDQRRLIMLFCMKCNEYETLQDVAVAFHMRISVDEWQSTKNTFVGLGFISEDNELLNWDKRQFISDTSTARVRKHRMMKKIGVDNDETLCNVTVTAPEQNRTDTEQSRTEIIPLKSNNLIVRSGVAVNNDFDVFWRAYPKKTGKDDARRAWSKKKPVLIDVLQALEWQVPSEQWTKQNGQFIPNPATYLNQGRWQDEPQIRDTNPF